MSLAKQQIEVGVGEVTEEGEKRDKGQVEQNEAVGGICICNAINFTALSFSSPWTGSILYQCGRQCQSSTIYK